MGCYKKKDSIYRLSAFLKIKSKTGKHPFFFKITWGLSTIYVSKTIVTGQPACTQGSPRLIHHIHVQSQGYYSSTNVERRFRVSKNRIVLNGRFPILLSDS